MLNIFFIIFAFFLHLFCFLFQQRIFFFLFQQRIKTNYTNFTNFYFSISRMIIFQFHELLFFDFTNCYFRFHE